jgi:hypothetical protein
VGSELHKQFFVEVSMPMVESKLALFEMQVESLFSDAVELPQARFRPRIHPAVPTEKSIRD